MKVIDLLNRIANKEDLPKKIKYDNEIYYLADFKNDGKSRNYYNEKTGYSFFFECRIINILNNEVELLEDEEIDIQEIKEMDSTKIYFRDGTDFIYKIMYNKINEIIRAVNKMQLDNKIKEK